MRILLVSHHFPPARTAGTETYAYNLARHLKDRHEVLVFHTDKRLARPAYALAKGSVGGVETRVLVNNLCYSHFGETFSDPRAEEAFCRGWELYRKREFSDARKIFEENADRDPPSRIFLTRCEYFNINPPPGDWDGVWVSTEK